MTRHVKHGRRAAGARSPHSPHAARREPRERGNDWECKGVHPRFTLLSVNDVLDGERGYLQLVKDGGQLGDAVAESLADADAEDGLVGKGAGLEGLAGELLPVVEDALGEGLAGGGGAEVGGESEGLGDGHVGADVVDGGTGAVLLADDDTTAAGEHVVDTTHGGLDGLDVDDEDGLHELGAGGQLGGVEDAAGGGDDLASTTVDGVGVHGHVLDVDADSTHVLVAHTTLLGGPLPGGDEGVLHLVHVLDTLGDVDDDVGAAAVGAVAPDLAGLLDVPVVGVGEVAGAGLGVGVGAGGLLGVLDVEGELLGEGSGSAEETVVLVGGLGEALLVGVLGDGLAEGDDGLGDLERGAVHEVVLEILQADLQVQLTGTGDDVLTGLLDGGQDEGIGLGQALEALDQLGQILGVLGLDGNTHDGADGVPHVLEGVGLLKLVGDGGGLDDVLVNTDQTTHVTAGKVIDGLLVAAHHEHDTLDGLLIVKVTLLAEGVVVTHDTALLAGADGTGEDTAEGEEATLV
eukprot:97799_1